MADTESRLRHWRTGRILAERLAGAVLSVEGYTDIDPQAPLGGGDGGKDIICSRDGRKHVAAVYFPTAQNPFTEIRTKFKDDLAGAKNHSPYAFIFVTNQTLTLGERTKLEDIAASEGLPCVLYHLERLRLLLDAPLGYGIRLEFLQIPMTVEEQTAFFAATRNANESALEQHRGEIQAISRKLDALLGLSAYTAVTTRKLSNALGEETDNPPDVPPDFEASAEGLAPLSGNLTIPLIFAFHRLACVGFPRKVVGKFRTIQVWIGEPATPPEAAIFTPPPWDKVPSLTSALISMWNREFPELDGPGSIDSTIEAIAKFHMEFLSIHPFSDGNGRAARALLEQQCIDLFGHADMSLFGDGAGYNESLAEAQKGNLRPLASSVLRIVFG